MFRHQFKCRRSHLFSKTTVVYHYLCFFVFIYLNSCLYLQSPLLLRQNPCSLRFHLGRSVFCTPKHISSNGKVVFFIDVHKYFTKYYQSYRYIESLQSDTRFITPWEKTLTATRETVAPVDVSKLPTQWLRPAAAQRPDEAVAALWKLRDFMMKDVLLSHLH